MIHDQEKKFSGKLFYLVGCRKCCTAGKFSLYTNGDEIMIACECGHQIDPLKDKPRTEPDQMPYDMRYFR